MTSLTLFIQACDTGATLDQYSISLQSLGADRRGSWTGAHDLLQDDHSKAGSWVHAYLHRKEGDAMNAGYWYRKAGEPVATNALEDEWEDIAAALLAKN
jgi:hypothetical protein